LSNTPRQKGNSNHSYQSCEFNISARVIQELDKNPLLKPKHLCYILGLDYLYYKNYVKNLRSKWKRNYRFGLHPKSPNSHNARAVVYVPKSCDRAFAINEGWEVSKNRNK
jgi:hypothetical protein